MVLSITVSVMDELTLDSLMGKADLERLSLRIPLCLVALGY